MAANLHTIASLTPNSTAWYIRATCTSNPSLRPFKNGNGQILSFQLSDSSASIQIKAFAPLANSIHPLIQVDHLYKITNAKVKPVNKNFNNNASASYEIILESLSLIQDVTVDKASSSSAIPERASHANAALPKSGFTKIAHLSSLPDKSICDVIGIVTNIGELSPFFDKYKKEPSVKRIITLEDETGQAVNVNLWRDHAKNCLNIENQRHPVLMLRQVRRSTFQGVCLEFQQSTTFEIDPVRFSETQVLQRWYGSQKAVTGRSSNIPQHAAEHGWKTFQVMICHAGSDKDSLAIPVYHALKKKGVDTFIDKLELKAGDDARSKMTYVAKTAQIGVFILSPEFCERKSTFEELRTFMDRRRKALEQGQEPPVILPVFYKMTPNDCSNPDLYQHPVFHSKDFFSTERQKQTPQDVVMKYIRELSELSGVLWEEEETGSSILSRFSRKSRTQEKTRKAFVTKIEEAVVLNLNRLVSRFPG